LLPKQKDLLKNPQKENHPFQDNLQLVAWIVSGIDSLNQEFLVKQQILSQTAVESFHQKIMNRPGKNGFAGVVNGKLIQFDVI